MYKRIALTLVVLIVSLPAAARKPCDELKAEIDTKIRANGVPEFTLDIVEADAAAQATGKVVGQCDGGSKRIVYLRGTPTTAAIAQTGK